MFNRVGRKRTSCGIANQSAYNPQSAVRMTTKFLGIASLSFSINNCQCGRQLPGSLPLTICHATGIPHPASNMLIDQTTKRSPILVASIAKAMCVMSFGSRLITHETNGAKHVVTSKLQRFEPDFASAS